MCWILDYLTNHLWLYVRIQNCMLDTVACITGPPQETVLVLFFFTRYTVDFFHYSTHCHLQRFSDDSAMVCLIRVRDDRIEREPIQDFV